jgi:hypothetical protein
LSPKDAPPRKVVIKICRTKARAETLNEFESLREINRKIIDDKVKTPQPVGIDQENKAIVMEYIDGPSLKQILLRFRPPTDGFLEARVELAAIALTRFHKIMMVEDSEPYSIESPFLEKGLTLGPIENDLRDCSLRFKTKSFVDFSVWNIIAEKGFNGGIFLTDFPDNSCISSPHIDIARFRYSLKIVNEYPQFRFLGISWWNHEKVFQHFLRKYCEEMGYGFSKTDETIVDWFERSYFKKLMSVYLCNKSSLKLTVERAYMGNLLRKSLSAGTGKGQQI